jgi:hypothetical protein
MPWTVQPTGRWYYVRRKRIKGKRHHEYFGKGPRAEKAAAEDAQKRQEQLALIHRRNLDREAWHQGTNPLEQLTDIATSLMKSALLSAGYYQHDKGEWRRKREDPERP